MIKIRKSPTADTRTCDFSNTSKASMDKVGGIDHSPLPWEFTYFTKTDGSEIKTVQDVADTTAGSALRCTGTTLWGISLKEPSEDGAVQVICFTGNGPHSEANARLIVAAVNALNITQDAGAALSSPSPARQEDK